LPCCEASPLSFFFRDIFFSFFPYQPAAQRQSLQMDRRRPPSAWSTTPGPSLPPFSSLFPPPPLLFVWPNHPGDRTGTPRDGIIMIEGPMIFLPSLLFSVSPFFFSLLISIDKGAGFIPPFSQKVSSLSLPLSVEYDERALFVASRNEQVRAGTCGLAFFLSFPLLVLLFLPLFLRLACCQRRDGDSRR